MLAFGSLAAGAARAATWGEPFAAAEAHPGVAHRPHVDGSATVRLLDYDGARLRLLRIDRGSKRARRCAAAEASPSAAAGFDANDAGAVALSFFDTAGRFYVRSARPRRCFARIQRIGRVPAATGVLSATVGPRGTVLVTWTIQPRADEPGRVDFASGPAGARVRRRGTLLAGRPLVESYVAAVELDRDDRAMWSLATSEWLDATGDRQRRRRWTMRSAPAGRPPIAVRGPVLEQEGALRSLDAWTGALLSPGGSEVVVGTDGARERAVVLTRRPGLPFERNALDVPAVFIQPAINARGDAVFAWEADFDVYALVRRRDGALVGPQLLTPGERPAENRSPNVAIDGAGRALVTWWSREPGWGAGQIRAAVSSRAGWFRGQTLISEPGGHREEMIAYPATNARGEAVVAWKRDAEPRDRVMLVRGRLDR